MTLLTPETVYRRYEVMGVPESGPHEPKKAEIVQLLSQIFGVSRGGWVVARTLTELNGITPEEETDGGVVLAGLGAGYYDRDAGSWVFGRGFPDTFARVALDGTGTAQVGIVNAGVDPATTEVFFAKVETPNTGALTLSIGGEPPRPVINLAGNPLEAGEWTGMVMFYMNDDGQYQLLIDAGSAASAAASATAAGLDADRAESEADRAQDLADGIIPGTVLDGSVTEPKLNASLAQQIILCVGSRSALKALNTARFRSARLVEGGREGNFQWVNGDFASSISADTLEGVFIKADAVAASAGAWVRQVDGDVRPEWYGAKRDGATNDHLAITQAAAYCATRGRRLLLSNGTYVLGSPLNLSSVKITHAENTIVRPTFSEGAAIIYSAGPGSLVFGPKLTGYLQVDWPSADYTKDRWSFFLDNVYMGEFHVGSRYSTLGLYLRGNQRGTVYNDIHLGYMDNNQVGIYCDTVTSAGWVNGNRFHGGFFTGDQPVSYGLYAAIASHLYIDNVPYENNGNVFLYPSLEWIGPNFKLAIIRGLRNKVLPLYAELDSTPGVAAAGAWMVLVGAENMVDCRAVPYMESARVDVAGATGSYVLT